MSIRALRRAVGDDGLTEDLLRQAAKDPLVQAALGMWQSGQPLVTSLLRVALAMSERQLAIQDKVTEALNFRVHAVVLAAAKPPGGET